MRLERKRKEKLRIHHWFFDIMKKKNGNQDQISDRTYDSVIAIALVAVFCIQKNMNYKLEQQIYQGVLADVSGRVLDKQAKITLDGTMKKKCKFLREESTFEGKIDVQCDKVQEKEEQIELGFHEASDQIQIASLSDLITDKNVGILCMDFLEPNVICLKFYDKYCKEHQMETGTMLVASVDKEITLQELVAAHDRFQIEAEILMRNINSHQSKSKVRYRLFLMDVL